jgi:hypothetical protein
MIYKNKGIDVKILQRKFDFQTVFESNAQNENQKMVPLQIPKRTKLFLDDM